jgi:fructose-1-phosphate kinase PfkB-like protein
MARPLIAKPTRSELEMTVGHKLDTEEKLHDAMRDIVRRGAQWVVVSQGGGTLWAFGDGRLYSAEPARVAVKNPIGSGDCLAAGMAVGLCRGCSVPEAIRWGMAAATANARTLLPARRELGIGIGPVDVSEAPHLRRIR